MEERPDPNTTAAQIVRLGALAALWALQRASDMLNAPLGFSWTRPLHYDPRPWSRHPDEGSYDDTLVTLLIARRDDVHDQEGVEVFQAGPVVVTISHAWDSDRFAFVRWADREVTDGSLWARRAALARAEEVETDARDEEAVRPMLDEVARRISAVLGEPEAKRVGPPECDRPGRQWLANNGTVWLALTRMGRMVEMACGPTLPESSVARLHVWAADESPDEVFSAIVGFVDGVKIDYAALADLPLPEAVADLYGELARRLTAGLGAPLGPGMLPGFGRAHDAWVIHEGRGLLGMRPGPDRDCVLVGAVGPGKPPTWHEDWSLRPGSGPSAAGAADGILLVLDARDASSPSAGEP